MSHKIYGQQVLFIGGDNPIIASTPEEMFALLTSDNVGKFVKYIGETGDFNFSTPTGRNIPVNPVTVDNSVEKWYFDTSVVPDFAQFAWSDLSSSETESIILCTVAVPGTTSGDKYILKVDRFPKGSRFADGWSRLKEDAYTIRIPFTSPAFKGYAYVSTEELAYQIKHTGANPPQVHQGWMVKQGTWNINDYGWWVTNVSQQDVWGGYISKDGKWVAEVINTNLSLVKDAFYKISEEIDIARQREVPILTNEGTAADLVSGKQLISSSGEVVTGTATIATENKLNQYFNKTITEVTEEDLAGVTSINNSAFVGCSSLASATIPDSVTTIGSYAFEGCASLTSVTIGNGVTSIDSYTFRNCSSLASVAIGSGVTSIGYYAFNNCTGLTSITIPDSVTSIDNYAFDNCTGLTSVTIGNGVTSIGDYAFRYCKKLTSITIPDSVTSIGDSAFYYCSELTSATIGNGVTSIGHSAFDWCQKLTSVTIGNSVTSIDDSAFEGCASLTSVTIPDSVTSIGDYAFDSCKGLTSVTIGNGVTSIGHRAFEWCEALTSVTIGSGVTSIGNYAFRYCTKLASITILPTTPPTLGSSAFYLLPSSAVITVPKGTLDTYKSATGWSAYASKMVEAAN